MLTPNEAKGLKDILNGLSTEDIFSITDTITKRMIVVESREEAIDAVLTFTENPSDLLRRQKITKKVLFGYIRTAKISVSPDGSKADFVRACLTFWLSQEKYQEDHYTEEQPEPHEQSSIVESQSFDVHPNSIIKLMGIEFTKWFFNLLNTLQEFGPQHFWPDCKLWVECQLSNSEIQTYGYSTSCDVVSFFNTLIAGEKYYFDANTANEAICCSQEQHGLVKVEISGVLHQHANCVGLFDSSFGLVRNPSQDYNWKIKVIQLKMNIKSPSGAIGSPYCQAIRSAV